MQSIYLAGGCFWCMEPPFDKLDGVLATTSGYIGGAAEDANYKAVSYKDTGHYEAVEIRYDPSKVTYEELLEVYWKNVDPLDPNGQFCDTGPSYKTAIFALTDEHMKLAEASKAKLMASGKLKGEIHTKVLPAMTFYPAEDYHQDYYQKNPIRYKYYRWGCGRDQRLEELWGA